jgi:hypothetical protein
VSVVRWRTSRSGITSCPNRTLVTAMAAPTGDRIAFTSGNSTELRVVDLATGTVTLLVETDGQTCSRSSISRPRASGSSSREPEVGGSYVSSLWGINADGSNHGRRCGEGDAVARSRGP